MKKVVLIVAFVLALIAVSGATNAALLWPDVAAVLWPDVAALLWPDVAAVLWPDVA